VKLRSLIIRQKSVINLDKIHNKPRRDRDILEREVAYEGLSKRARAELRMIDNIIAGKLSSWKLSS